MEAKFLVSYYVREGDRGFHQQTEEITIDVLTELAAGCEEVVFYSYTEEVAVEPGTKKVSIFYGSHEDAIRCEEKKPELYFKDDPGNRYYVLQINATVGGNLAFDEFKQKVTEKRERIQQESERKTEGMFASFGQKFETNRLKQEGQSPIENIRNSSHWLIRNKWLIGLAAILVLMVIASIVTLVV